MSYIHSEGNYLICDLCFHECRINEGEHGFCAVRFNEQGALSLPHYGRLSAVAIDPIEKKPLYHFHPGKEILSIGFYGCSYRCPFCQNYHISQNVDERSKIYTPEEVINLCENYSSFGIAYTYNEPTIHFEFIMDCSTLARQKGLKNVLVSNGNLKAAPARELLRVIDGANIDLKSFNTDFYRKEVQGDLETVLSFIEIASEETALEITTLVIPGKTDSPEEIREISRFIANLNADIPFHLSCYFPHYKYTLPPTESRIVLELADIARESLHYVYPGNVGHIETNTYCPACSNLLIQRKGYNTRIMGIQKGKCASCGSPVAVVLD